MAIHCDIQLEHPPTIRYETRIVDDRFYHFLESTRFWQQIPWAILFYMLFGWGGIYWGIYMRVSVCVTGHWLMGYFAHRWGRQHWLVRDAGVQGFNVPWCGLITMGECWHNNHHAFPDSAKLGLQPNQADPGWWFICGLQKLGLAWDVQQPDSLTINNHLIRLPRVHNARAELRPSLRYATQLLRKLQQTRRRICPFRQRL